MRRSKITAVILSLAVLATVSLAGCKKESKKEFPVVRFENNEVTVNGKSYGKADGICVCRMDEKVVSLSTYGGYINLDANGNELELGDIIKRSLTYKLQIESLVDMTIMTRNSLYPRNEVDHEAMMKVLTSYDEAMKLPFLIGSSGITVFYSDDAGMFSFGIPYDNNLVDPYYHPGDGMMCTDWMTGRVAYGTPDLDLDGFDDHWATSSLAIDNYNGKDYYWYCIGYTDADGDKTYYSEVVDCEANKVVYLEQVDGPFFCSDITEFASYDFNAGGAS